MTDVASQDTEQHGYLSRLVRWLFPVAVPTWLIITLDRVEDIGGAINFAVATKGTIQQLIPSTSPWVVKFEDAASAVVSGVIHFLQTAYQFLFYAPFQFFHLVPSEGLIDALVGSAALLVMTSRYAIARYQHLKAQAAVASARDTAAKTNILWGWSGGAALGLIVGGPVGALLGAVVGAVAGNSVESSSETRLAEQVADNAAFRVQAALRGVLVTIGSTAALVLVLLIIRYFQ